MEHYVHNVVVTSNAETTPTSSPTPTPIRATTFTKTASNASITQTPILSNSYNYSMTSASSPIPIDAIKEHKLAADNDSPNTAMHQYQYHIQSQQQPYGLSSSMSATNVGNLNNQGSMAAMVSSSAPSVPCTTTAGVATATSTMGTACSTSIVSSVTPPNSAGLRQLGAFEFKLRRQASLRIQISKKPSSDSINYTSSVPSSPGIVNWTNDNRDKYDGRHTDRTQADATKLNRKESYKAQRKNYRREKKRVASELLNSLQDPAVIVLADWLKIRGTLKSWTKLWCVLKPGLLLLYKTPKIKSSHWVGTILITSCQVIERPSKKDGFCFKLFHPLEQSIWAPRGPDKETIGAVVQPLPTSYLIFRAPSQAAGKCWMDALELSLRCSGLLLRSNSTSGTTQNATAIGESCISHETQWSEADYEKHFKDQDLDNDSQNEAHPGVVSGVDTDSESDANDGQIVDNQTNDMDNEEDMIETPYVPSAEEEFNAEAGEQVEELAEENKSLIWCLLKQVRPGMDLSKVVLPTFILEPRSFLDKLSDSYYHADILSRAVAEDDPLDRIKFVVKWYLSGFYKKPKGLKKPYNPILGESFRCYWEHPNGSRTYYIAEQVSHHPPVTAFYVTNRQEGFCISCSILAKSKFYGNSTSAVLDGVATLTLLPRGEIYTLTTPYAHCKGILMGTLSMELGGKVNIECENTGYKTELEFKLKPFLGSSDNINVVSGKLKLCKETLATINGHWDGTIHIKDIKSGEESVLFAANAETAEQRLKRYIVPMEMQLPNESERLWNLVSDAIRRDDQVGATEEKTVLEEIQRKLAKERKAKFIEWQPAYFFQDIISGKWVYKYSDLRPWDPRNDVKQYEVDYKILTKTKHLAPIVRTTSTVSVVPTLRRPKTDKKLQKDCCGEEVLSDSSQSVDYENGDSDMNDVISRRSIRKLQKAVDQVNKALDENMRQFTLIHKKLERLQYMPMAEQLSSRDTNTSTISITNTIAQNLPHALLIRSISYIMAAIALNYFLKWLLYN